MFTGYDDPELNRVMRQLSSPFRDARNLTRLHEQLVAHFLPSLESESMSAVVSGCTTVCALTVGARLNRMEKRLRWYLIVATSLMLAAVHSHW